LETRIAKARGGGSPAPTMVRRAVEEQTGADFSTVRVHNNKDAHSISAKLGAKAATQGKDIFLARGQSPHDLQLMAHELTHTIQQGAVKSSTAIQRSPAKGWVQCKKDVKNMDLDELNAYIAKHRGKVAGNTIAAPLWKLTDFLLTLPISVLDHLTALPIHIVDGIEFLSTGKCWKKRSVEAGYKPTSSAGGVMNDNAIVKRAQLARKGGLTGLRWYLGGSKYHKTVFGNNMKAKQTRGKKKKNLNPLFHMTRLGSSINYEKKKSRHKVKLAKAQKRALVAQMIQHDNPLVTQEIVSSVDESTSQDQPVNQSNPEEMSGEDTSTSTVSKEEDDEDGSS